MKYKVKELGKTGLHITLSKNRFKKGDIIEIPDPKEEKSTETKKELIEERVREIFQEELSKMQGEYSTL